MLFRSIGILPNSFPFIQLYNINPGGNVVIDYTDGTPQRVTLIFDNLDNFYQILMDKEIYGISNFKFSLTGTLLNIDPTSKDSWTFITNDRSNKFGLYYMIFDENGNPDSDGTKSVFNIKELGISTGDSIFNGLTISPQIGDSKYAILPNFVSNGLQSLRNDGSTGSF